MAVTQERLEKDLAADLATARRTARMRFGIVAALAIIALFNLPDVPVPPGATRAETMRAWLTMFGPLLAVGALGVAVVVALMRRDIRKAHDRMEEKRGFKLRKREAKK